jgi:NTP pyrophosphatase (non-canonical NTP hydrolase)
MLRAFAEVRDWEQYHIPKNLAMALAGETGELLACFQWLTPEESARVMQDPQTAAAVESELADVLQYLIRLADVLGIDLAEAVRKKVRVNESRFPPIPAARPKRKNLLGVRGAARCVYLTPLTAPTACGLSQNRSRCLSHLGLDRLRHGSATAVPRHGPATGLATGLATGA